MRKQLYIILLLIIAILTSCKDSVKEHYIKSGRECYVAFLNKSLHNPRFTILDEKYEAKKDDELYKVYWTIDAEVTDKEGYSRIIRMECVTDVFGITVNMGGKEKHYSKHELGFY